MSVMLIREQYKVIHVLQARQGYGLAEAVDISERETPTRLLNLYEGELLHRYGVVYSALKPSSCPEYCGMFLEGNTLVAVFDAGRHGIPIDEVFCKGDDWTWDQRLELAERLLHRALLLADLPPEIACAAMMSENVLVDPESGQWHLRFAIRPMEPVNARELALLTGDQLKKVLPQTLRSPEIETAFRERLDRGEFQTVMALYACWRELRPRLQEEYEAFANMGFFKRAMILLKRWYVQREKERSA